MSATAAKLLLKKCTENGIRLRRDGHKLKVRPRPEWLPPELLEQLRQHKREILCLLRPSQPIPKEPKRRPFLPRPLGQEDAVDPFIVWEGLFHWLIDHHPDHFYAVCDAEDAIRALEAQGVTDGHEYEVACQELLERFERARRLKLSQRFKIWLQ